MKTPLAILWLLFLVVQPINASDRRPVGIVHVVSPCTTTDDFWSCFNALPTLDQSFVDGIRVRSGFSSFAPSEGNFSWGNIDNVIAKTGSKGKFFGISLNFGKQGTPDWMYITDPPAPDCSLFDPWTGGVHGCMKWNIDPSDPGNKTQPVIWNTVYMARLHAMIQAFGARYDGNPTLSYVVASGFMQVLEMYLSDTPADDAHWNEQAIADGFPNKSVAYQFAAQQILTWWHEAFPTTPVFIATTRVWSSGTTDRDTLIAFQNTNYPLLGGLTVSTAKAILPENMPPPSDLVPYPYGSQEVYSSENPNFYTPFNPSPPPDPQPVNDFCLAGINQARQYLEIYENDLEIHGDPTLLAAAGVRLKNNVISTPSPTPTPTATPTPTPAVDEKYATTSNGVDLYWKAYPVATPAPAVLVLHPGGYKTGNPGPLGVCRDLQIAGFFALAVEYRLAPPHTAMNSHTGNGANHPVPAQDDVIPVDDGHFPEQTTDVMVAIHTARNDPRCDGRVYVIGGSAGASHSVFALGAGIPGDTQPDLAIANSCGVSNLGDPVLLGYTCVQSQTCPHDAITNYEGITDTWPVYDAPTLALLLSHSPVSQIFYGIPPIFVAISSKDSLGIPTSTGLAMHSYNDDGTIGLDETDVGAGLIPKLESLGITESTATIPEAHRYKKLICQTPVHAHAFDYWSTPINGVSGQTTKDVEIAWLLGGAGSPTPTATPMRLTSLHVTKLNAHHSPTPIPTPPGGPKPFPGGLYYLLQMSTTGDWSAVIPTLSTTFNKDWVDGFRIRVEMSALEPTEGSYNWSGLDDLLAAIAAAGKKATISVSTGIAGTPAWIYDNVPLVERFNLVDGDVMPLGFEPDYLAKWDAFVATFGARYDNNTTVSGVFFDGYGQQVTEYTVCPDTTDAAAWEVKAVIYGFSSKSDALRSATSHVMSSFRGAFPRTALLFTQGNPWGSGSIGNGDQTAAENASLALGGGISNSSLHAETTHAGIPSRVAYPHGYQAISDSTDHAHFYSAPQPSPFPAAPQPMHDLCESGYDRGAQYLEIYQYDMDGGSPPTTVNDSTFITERFQILSNLP